MDISLVKLNIEICGAFLILLLHHKELRSWIFQIKKFLTFYRPIEFLLGDVKLPIKRQ